MQLRQITTLIQSYLKELSQLGRHKSLGRLSQVPVGPPRKFTEFVEQLPWGLQIPGAWAQIEGRGWEKL